jgi:serine/threonine-protein kinase
VDRRIDVFSLGIVLWELSIGKRLFRRDTDMASLMAITSNEVPRPRALRADYPPQLEAIVLKALAHDPDDRYQTCRELRDDLAEFMTSTGYVVTSQRLGEWIRTVFEHQPLTIPEILAVSRTTAR